MTGINSRSKTRYFFLYTYKPSYNSIVFSLINHQKKKYLTQSIVNIINEITIHLEKTNLERDLFGNTKL